MYTASVAFFEAIWDAGITHCFVNLGSDHPSIMEVMVQRQHDGRFFRIMTCPSDPWIEDRICHAPFALLLGDGSVSLESSPEFP
ncbi:thiamine diphosphate-binding protein [Penicillium samsonianum]|uniref:thiamine diphosphate-binding protein n=1 Tax=Penicillium samsonianum TaxID=1882272 RepID=UPI0025492B7F|nr:thiamine diphosphate-binding protein [Penicillium samsonianum]KAJ6119018.1 thiamine diphosphate-binding protein [Penicillium samsonianum]